MLLQNLNIPGKDETKDIRIVDDRIRAITSDPSSQTPDKNELNLVFENAIAFPGLINSHDHLDFDLFAQTGNRIYDSYIEWGTDIQLHKS
jgi:cytosine/adenosine deaminase-related metal-dependent hydrolase